MGNEFYYLINVSGKHGYSFMVCSADELYEEDVIESALENGLFEDDVDAEYAMVDDLVSDRDIDHFRECGCLYEI